MIFWRIKFDPSEAMPATETGYQVMDADLVTIGVFDDTGTRCPGTIAYHTTDSGNDPTIGVEAPSWAGSIDV